MSCFASPSRSSWISLSAMPRARTSRRIQSVKSMLVKQLGHAVLYWHTLAWPRILAPKERIVSSLSWRMLWRATRATIMFSSRTASHFMALRTSSSDCVVKLFLQHELGLSVAGRRNTQGVGLLCLFLKSWWQPRIHPSGFGSTATPHLCRRRRLWDDVPAQSLRLVVVVVVLHGCRRGYLGVLGQAQLVSRRWCRDSQEMSIGPLAC